jgi:hypothetical protein
MTPELLGRAAGRPAGVGAEHTAGCAVRGQSATPALTGLIGGPPLSGLESWRVRSPPDRAQDLGVLDPDP